MGGVTNYLLYFLSWVLLEYSIIYRSFPHRLHPRVCRLSWQRVVFFLKNQSIPMPILCSSVRSYFRIIILWIDSRHYKQQANMNESDKLLVTDKGYSNSINNEHKVAAVRIRRQWLSITRSYCSSALPLIACHSLHLYRYK